MRVLIIEDDAEVAAFLSKGLREQGHTVDHADNRRDGLFLAAGEAYDALIVDRMLPAGGPRATRCEPTDGLAIVRTLRANGEDVPVVVLSALGEVDDRVAGLRAGGDDYLTKPFAMSELIARLDAVVRRRAGRGHEETVLRVADLELDRLKRTVTRGGARIELKPREFQLLEFLMQHGGQVVTRTMLLEGVWDYHFDPQTNVIDVHISRLRRKIDRPGAPALIHTLRGAGYALRASEPGAR